MPSLRDAYGEFRAPLADRLGGPERSSVADRPGDAFLAILTGLLSASFAPNQAAKVVQALASSGLDSPEALAEADLTELVEATRGIRGPTSGLSPKVLKPIQRLARVVVESGGVEALERTSTECFGRRCWPSRASARRPSIRSC